MADRNERVEGDPPPAKGDTEKFLAWLEGVPDPQERYRRATEELEKHQQVVERLSSVRATAAAAAYESGETVRALAERLGVSPSRVHQLIKDAKSRSISKTSIKKRRTSRKKGGAS